MMMVNYDDDASNSLCWWLNYVPVLIDTEQIACMDEIISSGIR